MWAFAYENSIKYLPLFVCSIFDLFCILVKSLNALLASTTYLFRISYYSNYVEFVLCRDLIPSGPFTSVT